MDVSAQARTATYDSPGGADDLSSSLRAAWNETIVAVHRKRSGEKLYGEDRPETLESPFFVLDAAAGRREQDEVMAKWSPDPSVAVHCLGLERAKELCDSGIDGRHAAHAEYAEYQVVVRDGRAKRVQVTTELREYWLCVAVHAPRTLRDMAEEVLGFRPSWEDLYGGDPYKLEADERLRAFATRVAGRGDTQPVDGLEDVPVQPTGPLNTKHLLFMTYPLNGLDDVMELLLLGARPWAVQDGQRLTPATPIVVFTAFGAPDFACRRSDPTVIAEAADAAFAGYKVTMADPPGVSILGFPYGAFTFRDQPLPEAWVRPSRGRPGHYQRLEVGPGDEDDAFLEDIFDVTEQQPLTGGFQLLRQLELGLRLVRWAPTPVAEGQWELADATPDLTLCSDEERCKELQEAFDRLGGGVRPPLEAG